MTVAESHSTRHSGRRIQNEEKIRQAGSRQENLGAQNGAKAVKMFKAGKSVPDIAEKFGDRSKQNRVRAALFAAGVYQYSK